MNALHQWDINHVINPQGRQRRLDNRNSYNNESMVSISAGAPTAHKQSQFYCVGNHEQPRRGESLFASTEQPVYRLEPSPEGRGPGERWSPFFDAKEGDGG